MAMSTFQKVTLATCLVLCVALLLPKLLLSRGRKDAAERPEGHFPPMMHRQAAPEGRSQRPSGFSRAHNTEGVARAKGAGPGAGTGGKSNLAGQIIPVYGFGILLYILYILFKITSKGNNKASDSGFPCVRSENMKRKITDFELVQLQERLRETELVMENMVSNAHSSPERVKGVMADQEESLLQQLTEITRVMQEGQMVEQVAPENQEDDGEGSEQRWSPRCCCCHHSQRAEADQTDGRESAVQDEDVRTRVAADQKVEKPECKEAASHVDLAGVLEELELKMTSMMEQEKVEVVARTSDTQCSAVRRRNKTRKAKKASQEVSLHDDQK